MSRGASVHRLESTLRAKCGTVCHSADMYMLLCSCVPVYGICPQCDIVFVSTCMSRGGQCITKTQTEDASEVRVAGWGGSGQAVFTLRSGKSRCSGLGTKVLIMT